jgi:hypothetical protein
LLSTTATKDDAADTQEQTDRRIEVL